jgi:hypothetical protein
MFFFLLWFFSPCLKHAFTSVNLKSYWGSLTAYDSADWYFDDITEGYITSRWKLLFCSTYSIVSKLCPISTTPLILLVTLNLWVVQQPPIRLLQMYKYYYYCKAVLSHIIMNFIKNPDGCLNSKSILCLNYLIGI